MQVGIDSFAAAMPAQDTTKPIDNAQAMSELLERMRLADEVGLDYFGIGEHYRAEFLDSSPTHILAAAAAQTKRIKLGSAVTVLSAHDPVRVYQNFATLDLISRGRAEIVVGRGSFTEAFPLFGLDLSEYDEIFVEKLDLLLRINAQERITWSGRYRPALRDQYIYPRAHQQQLPIWLGVGGTPESFVRAGTLGLPLMVAIIGGQTHRFRPLIDLYREAGRVAGHPPERLTVGLHSLGYVARTRQEAIDTYWPGYSIMFSKIGRERGWGPITMDSFLAQTDDLGAYLIGSPEEVAVKILRHSEALGGISRVTFQMDNAGMSHEALCESIRLIGQEVSPRVNAHA